MKGLKYTIFLLAVLPLFFVHDIDANAQPSFVDECLEEPERCDEELVGEEDEEGAAILQEEESGNLFFELIRVFFALLLVLGIIYAFLYFLKRKNKFGNRINSLENVGGISVGQNKSVQLVRLGDRFYLIGVGEDINLLQEIKDEALIEEIIQSQKEQPADLPAGNLLFSFFNRKEAKENDGKFNSLFREELDRMQKNRKSIIDRHKEDKNE